MIRNNKEIGMKTRGFRSNENSQAQGSRPVCRVPHDDAANYDYYIVITVFAFKTQRNYMIFIGALFYQCAFCHTKTIFSHCTLGLVRFIYYFFF